MLKRLTEREQIANLLDQYAVSIRQAFLEAVADIANRLTLTLMVARLERGDVPGAVEAIGIERGAFNPVLDKIAEAFNAGGTITADNLPVLRDPEGHRVSVRFDVRNLRAESILRQHSAELVTNIVDDQRTAIRAALSDGLARGQNPRVTALDVVGRVSRASGSRVGGIIGLSAPQAQAVSLASQELSSGKIDGLRNYLTRERRDRRFDKIVLAAIRDEKPIPADMRVRMVGRYADRLLQLRGEVLSQNETHVALFAGKNEAFQQAIDAGKLSPDAVTKTWRHFPSDHPRMQHVEMQGKAVGFNEPFVMPDGTLMAYPHAPGAPARHTLGCKCQADYRVDHVANFLARRAA